MRANNLVEMLYQTVSRFPDKDAIMWKVDGAYTSISYQTFWNRIKHAAAGLSHLGIQANDKVAILSNSNPMWGITDFATASIGAVSVPIYPTLPAEEVAYILNNGDVKVAVVESEEQLHKIRSVQSQVEYTVIMYPSAGLQKQQNEKAFWELEADGEENALPDWEKNWRKIGREHLATIIHTSGTTGKPKGVMLSHGNFLANLEGVQFWVIELLPEDVSLSYLPLSHVFERMAGHYMPLSVGTTIAYAESIDKIEDNLKEVQPTVLTSVPRLFEKVYAKVQDEINNGSSIKQRVFNWALNVGNERYNAYFNAGIDQLVKQEAMPKKLKRKWKIADRLVYQQVKQELGGRLRGMVSGGGTLNPEIARFFWAIDLPVLEGYGLTETTPVITSNPMIRTKTGTVGKPLPNLHVQIAEDGEVLVKGPSVMQGYYNNAEETEKAFDGEWYLTGDIGEMDEDGYLRIIDRKKRILVLSTGKNVAPQPIESVINESNYIENSVVIGDNRKYVISLINPDYDNLVPWAEQNGIPSEPMEAIVEHPKAKEMLEGEVERLTASLAKFEQPKKVIITGEPWTEENGILTPKLSIRLKVIEEKYHQLIEDTYHDEGTAQSETVAATKHS